jgi:hypothetical protein
LEKRDIHLTKMSGWHYATKTIYLVDGVQVTREMWEKEKARGENET